MALCWLCFGNYRHQPLLPRQVRGGDSSLFFNGPLSLGGTVVLEGRHVGNTHPGPIRLCDCTAPPKLSGPLFFINDPLSGGDAVRPQGRLYPGGCRISAQGNALGSKGPTTHPERVLHPSLPPYVSPFQGALWGPSNPGRCPGLICATLRGTRGLAAAPRPPHFAGLR